MKMCTDCRVILDEAHIMGACQFASSAYTLHREPTVPQVSSHTSKASRQMRDGHRLPTQLPSRPALSPAARLFSTSRIRLQADDESILRINQLPHLTQQSTVHQVSVSDKATTYRRALAIGHVVFSNPQPLQLVCQHALKKGDVLAVARVAAIMAVKKTSDLIPLTHSGVGVEGCVVDVELVGAAEAGTSRAAGAAKTVNELDLAAGAGEEAAKQLCLPIGSHGGIRIAVSVSTTAKTGLEMEALTGVVGAGLTVIDMCKAVDRHLRLDGVAVVGKTGGKSGAWGVFLSPEP